MRTTPLRDPAVYLFTSVYSDGATVREGYKLTADPEEVVQSILAFRADQTEAPIRVDYRRVPCRLTDAEA